MQPPPPPFELNPLVKLAFCDQTYMQNQHYGSRRHVRVERPAHELVHELGQTRQGAGRPRREARHPRRDGRRVRLHGIARTDKREASHSIEEAASDLALAAGGRPAAAVCGVRRGGRRRCAKAQRGTQRRMLTQPPLHGHRSCTRFMNVDTVN